MSSFEASAALNPQASGYRRSAPVAPTSQQRVIPVAELTAPAVGAIAPFVAPTLNTSAASDLETAMQAITNAGKAAVAAGSYAESIRRDEVYAANNMAMQDIPAMMQRYQEGKLNELISTQDLHSFASQQSSDKIGMFDTQAGRDAYSGAVYKVASDMWLDKSKNSQMASFKTDAEGVTAGFFLPNAQPFPASSEWQSFKAKYPWLDEGTFKATIYGSALENAAKTGNSSAFSVIEKSMDGATDSPLLVEPARKKLDVQLRAAQEIANKNYKETVDGLLASGEAPSVIIERARDAIGSHAPNDTGRQRGLLGSFVEDMAAKAGTLQDLRAITMESEANLDPSQHGRVQLIAQQRARPLIYDGLMAQAKDPTVANFRSVAEQNGLSSLSPSDQVSVLMNRRKAVEDYASDAMLQGYERGTMSSIEFSANASAARDKYQADQPDWNQPEDALSPDAFLRLVGKGREIDSSKRTLNMANAYLTGQNLGDDGTAKGAAASAAFSSVLTKGNLIDFSDGGKVFVGMIKAQKQVPDAAWYHVLTGLRGSDVEGRRNAVRALTIINKMSEGDLANKSPTLTDNTANAAVGRTLDVLRPLTSRLQTANLSDQQADAIIAAYDTTIRVEQHPMLPANSMADIKTQLNIATASKAIDPSNVYISRELSFDPSVSLTMGMDGSYSAESLMAAMTAVTDKMYQLSKVHPIAASQQARDVSAAVMQRVASNTTLLTGPDIDRMLTEELTRRQNTVEVATIGDAVVGTWEPRNDLPRWTPANQTNLSRFLQSSSRKSSDIDKVVPTPAGTFYVIYNDGTIGQFDAARTN
jgi:hypothetical protein